jgi:hypothetical protein
MLCEIKVIVLYVTLMICDVSNCMAVDQFAGWMMLFALLVNIHGQIKEVALSVIGLTKFTVPTARVWWANKFKKLYLFAAQMDGEWCSLQELGPLCQLRRLEIGWASLPELVGCEGQDL